MAAPPQKCKYRLTIATNMIIIIIMNEYDDHDDLENYDDDENHDDQSSDDDDDIDVKNDYSEGYDLFGGLISPGDSLNFEADCKRIEAVLSFCTSHYFTISLTIISSFLSSFYYRYS